jgi:microcompartment protein CcmL/EutN
MAVKSAIGILETRGFAPLVIGADAALKAANVEMVEWRQVGSGYVSFTIQGDSPFRDGLRGRCRVEGR